LVEAYVDNMVVKTREIHTLVNNLQRTFTALNKYQWKLNPKSVSLESHLVYYWATSSVTMAYAPIQQR
jgi:Holliday junction resolvasome RuvABC endonuclease subunit